MRKILGVIVLGFIIALAGCIPVEQAPTGLTETEIEALVESYIEANKDDFVQTLTDDEVEAIVFAYLDDNQETLVSELTSDQIEELVDQYFIDHPVEDSISTTYDLASFEAAVTDMLQQVSTGVLGVYAVSDYSGGTGSGVVYKKEGADTYYLVTNRHVVVHDEEDAELGIIEHVATDIRIVYEKNGLLFEIVNGVTLIGYDETTDLAVIQFDTEEDFNVIPFGNSYEVEIGQIVYAIGNPLGFDYYGTVTSGIISGEARYVKDGLFDATLLQHDAAISPGNSGGALVNINGELIGINNMKIVSDDVSNIGFAIPVNTVKRIVEDLEDDGEITRPYLGISTFAQVNDCGLDYGVCVVVGPGGAADNAGLIDGDIIIGYLNEGETEYLEITNFNDLREAILNSSVGETIKIKYIRFEEVEGVLTPITYESYETVLNVHPDDQ
jgi:serine protease Do